MSRKLLIILAIPVVLVVVTVLLLPVFLDEDKFLRIAADTLEEKTGAILRVKGGASFSIFPRVTLELGDASITMPGEQEMKLQLESLGIGLELLPLFYRKLSIDNISIDGLRMTVQSAPEQPALDTSTLSDEQLDDFYQKRRQALDTANQVAGQESIAALPLALNVQSLLVTNSLLELVAADKQTTTRVKIIKLQADGLNLDDSRLIPLLVRIQLEGQAEASPVDVELEGEVRLNADTRILTLERMSVVLEGVMAEPVTVQASGVVELIKQTADLQIVLTLGELRGEGALRYASFETPQIDAKLHLNMFDPALFALAGPEAAAVVETQGEPSGGEAGDQPLPLNAIRAIDTRAKLSIDRAIFSGHVVNNMQVKLRAVDGIVRLNSLTGTVHGGALDMKATLNAKHSIAKLNTRGGLTALDIAMALNAMDSDPLATGKANLDWELNSSGNTSNLIMAAMKGAINLQTSDVVLQQMSIEKMLCEAVALANGESLTEALPEITTFQNLSVKLHMDQGKLQMKPLRAELAYAKLSGEGALNLLQQNFHVVFKARLSDDMGELDPACRVNSSLTAIAWPVNCKGALDGEPVDWCGVDSKKILKDLATNEVQRQIEKEGGKLLDKLFNR